MERRLNFFISHNSGDAVWAEWIAGELEDNGYKTVLQDWDFRPGQNFVQQMQKAVAESERTIAVFSPEFGNAVFTQPEWQAAFGSDPKGEEAKLIPIIVRKFEPEGLLSKISYIDIADKNEEEARRLLLDGLKKGRAKKKLAFPGSKAARLKTSRRFPGSGPEIFHIPHRRNPNFTGREALLRKLRQTLRGGESAALTQAAMHGLGGVGKTQLAIEYVYRYASDYSVVWWLRSETRESLNADYEELGRKLGLVPEREGLEQAQVVELVREDLARRTGWLLVLDNVPHPNDVKGYLPLGSAGHVLITSRYGSWSKVARPLSVKAWEPEEAIHFLLSSTGQSDEAAAKELAEELGYLPLALEQAASYAGETGRSLAGYLELFRAHRLRLFDADSNQSSEELTVKTTWDLSVRQARGDAPASADLLHLCAFLGPDDIPLDVILGGVEHLPRGLVKAATDPLELDKTIRSLWRYSLVEVGGGRPEERSLSIHRLVQEVTRERLSVEDQRLWTQAAVGVVNKAFPAKADDVRNWPACARLSPHAAHAAAHAENLQVGLEAAGRLLNQLGVYANGRAELDQAERYLGRALAIHEKVYGRDHPEVGTDAGNIGQILKAQGDLAGALEYTQRALAIDEKAFGPEHPKVAADSSNIGQILKAQGDLSGALEYTQRALAIGENAYGPDHPDVATDANNIGAILCAQGDLSGALEYTRRALAIGEKVYGPDHPNVAIRANNIGQVLKAQGDLRGALEYTQRALAIFEKAYGPDHPNVGTLANNIGAILQDQGDLTGALEYTQRALAIDERAYGPEHPDVAVRANNIGSILLSQGDRAGALEYTRRALRIFESTYGADNPSTKTVARNLEAIREAIQ